MSGIAVHEGCVGSTAGPPALRNALPEICCAAVFLDFDGTLVEIASRPDAVELPPGTGELLGRLQAVTEGAVALVSGRSLADLERMLPGYYGILVGSHGAERRVDGIRSVADQGKSAAFSAARDELSGWVRQHDDVLLETKPASLVLHYRGAPHLETACTQVLDAVAQRLPGFAVRPSKMALELMPETVSKRSAVLEMMEVWSGRMPVAIGDDRTDEGMFAVAQALGGHGIKVGPGKTDAGWRVGDVAAVHSMLRRWLDAEGA